MGRILTIGSINADYIYRVPHLPAPGETLAAQDRVRMLGGKGANQSIAAALAGAQVAHAGAIGQGDTWLIDALAAKGVDTTQIAQVAVPSGHAIIAVDPNGENAILLLAGANDAVPLDAVRAGLAGYGPGDICLLQNEVSITPQAAEAAAQQGLTVIYSAAPFQAEAVKQVLPHVDLLVMNEGEAAALTQSLGQTPEDMPQDVLVTRGAEGATYFGAQVLTCPAFSVRPVDTTGAGDCYIGTFAARRALGADLPEALRWAAAASAIQVTRPGTADAMPTAAEVAAFLATQL